MSVQYTTLFHGCTNDYFQMKKVIFLAHLSRRLIGEPIVCPSSGVRRRRRSLFSNIFSSVIAWPIKAKFYVKTPMEGGQKFV